MTPVCKARQASHTYIVCLDCGKHFSYDLIKMRMGAEISGSAVSGNDARIQQASALNGEDFL
jgi:hypothetical protein